MEGLLNKTWQRPCGVFVCTILSNPFNVLYEKDCLILLFWMSELGSQSPESQGRCGGGESSRSASAYTLGNCPIPLKNKDQEGLSMSFEHLLPSPPVWPPGLLVSTSRHPLPSELLSLGSFKVLCPPCLRAFVPAVSLTKNVGPVPLLQLLILILQFPSGSLSVPMTSGPGLFYSTDQPSRQALMRLSYSRADEHFHRSRITFHPAWRPTFSEPLLSCP